MSSPHLVVLLFLYIISLVYSADFYFAGSSSAQFSLLTNWRMGSITGVIATVLPSEGDNIYFTNSQSYTVTFSSANAQSYGKIVIGSNDDGNTQTLKLDADLKANEIEIRKSGVLEVSSGFKVTGDSSIVVQQGGKVLLNGELDFNGELTMQSDAELTWNSGKVSSSVNEIICNGQIFIKGSAEKSLETMVTLKQGAKMQVEGTGKLLLSALVAIENGADLEFSGSGHIEASNSNGKIKIENQGSMEVSSGTTFLCDIENQGYAYLKSSTIYLNKTYSQTSEAAVTYISDAEVVIDGASGLVMKHGNLSCDGTIRAEGGVTMESETHFLIGGRYENQKKSCSTSTSTIYGNFRVKNHAWLEVTMESSSCYDRFRIFGQFIMETHSRLYLRGRNFYVPRQGTTFDIATHTTREGSFGVIQGFGIFDVKATYTPILTRVEIRRSLAGTGSLSALSFSVAVLMTIVYMFQ